MKRLSAQEQPHSIVKVCIFLYLLMVLVRVVFSIYHPPRLSFSMADSERYYYSGLYFAQTGQICYPVPVKSAWIMPGISILIGTLARLFSEETQHLWAIRICWILIGSLAPVFIYRSARLFIPHTYALFAAACYLLPWYIEYDCYVTTEGPAFALLTIALYYGLASGRAPSLWRNVVPFSIFLVLSVLFRASGLFLLPVILIWQLLCRKTAFRTLLRNVFVSCAFLAVLIVPWSIRNARVFHDFIPLTYTTGDVIYEGSYVGEGVPSDDEFLAVYENDDPVEDLLQTKPYLFDAEGNPIDDSALQYISHLGKEYYGKGRMRLWFRLRPMDFLKTQLYLKPKSLLNDVWYWDQVFGVSLNAAVRVRQINLLFCLLAGLLSILRKKLILPVWFLGITYVVNLYIVASALPVDRYGQACMPYRLILGAIGVYLLADFLQSKIRRKNLAETA